MPKNKKDDLSGEIIKVHGELRKGDHGRLIYASVSWNGREAKDEIRNTWIDKDGEEHIGKGIAISDEEMESLIEAYHNKQKHEAAVDFGNIFREAETIGEMREAGNPTKDGFMLLSYRDGHSPNTLKHGHNKK